MRLAIIKMMMKEPVSNWDSWCLKKYAHDDFLMIRKRFPSATHMIGYCLHQKIPLSHDSLQHDIFTIGVYYLEFFYKYLKIVRKIWEYCLSSLSMSVFLYERLLGIFKNIQLSTSFNHYQKIIFYFIIVTIDLIKNGDLDVALMTWDQRVQDLCPQT